jgi:serine/threonine-protein kinase
MGPGGATAPSGGGSDRRNDDLVAGTVVGEYRVERELGRGGMAAVYAAQHPVIGKRVAIKVISENLSRDPALVRRFVDEARAVNKIGHPNIIDIFAFGQLPDGRQYFVMEFLEGETLAARLGRGPFTMTEARRLFVQAASGLEAAHREKIVHRDLKPENLWVAQPKHGESYMKILDFGIAKLLELTEGRNLTETGVVIGTPHFMSPEQCTGQNVDHRTDLYALGVILYRVFAGRLPFEGRTFAEVVAQHLTVQPPPPSSLQAMSPALENLIVGCLDKDPARRPQTAAEVGRRLEEALGGSRIDEIGATATAPMATGGGAPGTRSGFATGGSQARAAIEPAKTRSWGRLILTLVLVGALLGGVAAVILGKRMAQERLAALRAGAAASPGTGAAKEAPPTPAPARPPPRRQ